MPLVWDIIHDEKLVVSRTEGSLHFDDLRRYFEALHLEGALAYRKLTDARQGRCEIPDSERTSFLGAATEFAKLTPPGPLAVVVTEESSRTHHPMLQVLFAFKERPAKLFLDLDEAMAWIRHQPLPEVVAPGHRLGW